MYLAKGKLFNKKYRWLRKSDMTLEEYVCSESYLRNTKKKQSYPLSDNAQVIIYFDD